MCTLFKTFLITFRSLFFAASTICIHFSVHAKVLLIFITRSSFRSSLGFKWGVKHTTKLMMPHTFYISKSDLTYSWWTLLFPVIKLKVRFSYLGGKLIFMIDCYQESASMHSGQAQCSVTPHRCWMVWIFNCSHCTLIGHMFGPAHLWFTFFVSLLGSICSTWPNYFCGSLLFSLQHHCHSRCVSGVFLTLAK